MAAFSIMDFLKQKAQEYIQNRAEYFKQNPLSKILDPNQFKTQNIANEIGQADYNIRTKILGFGPNLEPPALPPTFGGAGAGVATAVENAPVINALLGQAGKIKLGSSVTKLERPAIDSLKTEGGKLLKSLSKDDRLQHIIGYPTELLRRGFTKEQVNQIGFEEAAGILKKGITPLERFGSKSLKFSQDVASGLKPEGYPSELKGPQLQQGELSPQPSGASQQTTLNQPIQPFQKTPLKTLTSLGDIARAGESPNLARIDPFEKIIDSSPINVKSKVNLLDYLRTPENVLQKIGLGEEAGKLRRAYENYLQELPQEINRVTEWAKQVPTSSQSIFKYLDGTLAKESLNPTELKVAGEIKDYLKNFADRLGLPQEKRITNYITHIFDRELTTKEFDPDIAKLIQDKIPGSVYDPFTLQRLGKQGYKEDVWQALDAYIKRGIRKVNMDPVLEEISKKSGQLEDSQYNYVQRYLSGVNLRPTETETLIDNFIKSTPIGYKFGQRPTTVISRNIRQAIYRGTLGLNVGSALKNLTQGANTFAKLGTKYTTIGYTNMIKNFATGSDELEKVGVLGQDFIQDRTINATRKFWENTDKGLLSLFEGAEKVNRGAAYFGAKARALDQGKSLQEAVEFAKKVVRDTQFQFGSIDTPVAMQSDIAKFVSQFQSYNVKQVEFLGGMIKNKDIGGLLRYTVASLALVSTVGKALGMTPKDLIPTLRIGNTPFFTLAGDIKDTVMNNPDQYGNQPTFDKRAGKIANDIVPFIPGGVQARKTIRAVNNMAEGGIYNKRGDQIYEIPQNPYAALQSLLFGPKRMPQ